MAKKKAERRKQRKVLREVQQDRENSATPESIPTAWWRDRKTCLMVAVIVLVTLIAFLPSLKNEFTNWDDNEYVTDNPAITGLSLAHLKTMVTTVVSANYHPLTVLSLAFNYRWSGLDPAPYILTNLLLHLLNTLLVFHFIYSLSSGDRISALVVSLLFGIHPMHVESVTWISERKDVLFSLFYLLALILYMRYRRRSSGADYALLLTSFLLSLLSKPAAVTLPVALLLLDYYSRRKMSARLLIEKAPLFFLSILFGVITLWLQSTQAIGDMETYRFMSRAAFASYGFVVYLAKLVLPVQLSAFYPYPMPGSGLPGFYLLCPWIVLILVAGVVWSARRTRVILFGFLFFVVHIILVLQLLGVGSAIMADRYTYLPYIGLFFIVGTALSHVYRNTFGHDASRRTVLTVGSLFYVGFLAYTTFARTQVWKDSETLWSDVIRKHTNVPHAFNNRGNVYWYEHKQPEKALADYERALELKPNYAEAYYNRGNIFFTHLQDYDRALHNFNQAVRYNPSDAPSHNNLGTIHFNFKKNPQLALNHFNKAIRIRPHEGKYYLNRSRCYFKLGDYGRARKEAARAAQLGGPVDAAYLRLLER